jgi:hypothetical protein
MKTKKNKGKSQQKAAKNAAALPKAAGKHVHAHPKPLVQVLHAEKVADDHTRLHIDLLGPLPVPLPDTLPDEPIALDAPVPEHLSGWQKFWKALGA